MWRIKDCSSFVCRSAHLPSVQDMHVVKKEHSISLSSSPFVNVN